MSSAQLEATTNGVAKRNRKKHRCYWTWDFANLLLLIRRTSWATVQSDKPESGRRKEEGEWKRREAKVVNDWPKDCSGGCRESWLRVLKSYIPCCKCTEFGAWVSCSVSTCIPESMSHSFITFSYGNSLPLALSVSQRFWQLLPSAHRLLSSQKMEYKLFPQPIADWNPPQAGI